ncbi:hypothetical protein [Anaplasma platys]|uniref:hypothetical protein n=1 Tax=Anaplasma platys TaxID=949 RepID=UPI00145CF339|nr:hypothetical protein [Anaplasma platys]
MLCLLLVELWNVKLVSVGESTGESRNTVEVCCAREKGVWRREAIVKGSEV